MVKIKAFDNRKYIKLQSEAIKKTSKKYDKLYLEVGGKLLDDSHASRVLPGFLPDAKIRTLQSLKDDIEIIFCIKAEDIDKKRLRADYQISYDAEIIKLINKSRELGFTVNSVVVTLYNGEESVDKFTAKMNRHNIKTYVHTFTKGYPTDVETIVSNEGYGKNEYIKTDKKIILVNAPGSGSGKLATCLSQLYHEHKKDVNAGYAKFETFPVWDLPLRHPLNIAYESATTNLNDIIMIDHYHLEKYNKSAVNYNRDVENFPILQRILKEITKKQVYNSPTDMGINVLSKCILNEQKVIEASKKEIIRRYFKELSDYKAGNSLQDHSLKVKQLMNELKIDETHLDTVLPAREKSIEKQNHAIAIKLRSRKIITGRKTEYLSPASSVILNAIKHMSKIPDDINLISPILLQSIIKLKNKKELSLDEVLTTLSITAPTNPMIEKALTTLERLDGCDGHATYIIQNGDLNTLKSLNINITCDPEFYSDEII